MRIAVTPQQVQLQGRYNNQTRQHEPPGTTVYHPAWGGRGNGVTEWAVALDPLPDSGNQEYHGRTRAPLEGETPTLAKCVRVGYLSSAWYAVRDLTVEAEVWKKQADGSLSECRAGCREPHAHFQVQDGQPRELPAAPRSNRPITAEPRIVSLSDYSHREANSEGCMVVVDDVAAVAEAVATGKYHGPPGPVDLDYITYPARLPGRRYLSSLSAGVVAPVPRFSNGAARWSLATLALVTGVGTVFETWEEAQQAISHAREQGVLPK